MTSSAETYFGGPDKNKNLLRDVLIQHIEAVPSNGNISWVCYYLNDPEIIQALINASKRGVQINLTIDGRPRTPSINQLCIDKFNLTSINLIIVKRKPFWEYFGIHWHPHLHSKLFYFSHPTPRVLIGSYNPTAGDQHIDATLIDKIGDHSISHNVLVAIDEENSVNYLHKHILKLQLYWQRMFARLAVTHNTTFHSLEWEINFLPSLRKHPINKLLSNNESNVHVKCAISHLKGLCTLKPIKAALKTGKKIELLLESSQRRVPNKHLVFLDKHAIKYYQPKLDKNCLMHNKFIIYKSDQQHCVMFGSFNWSSRSMLLNNEIIACSHDKNTISAFEARWNQLIK
ncbi:MAG: phospholipase D-like domain-containing protein [Gammaproteobacteria bacterium]